jgi:hypothetical protein
MLHLLIFSRKFWSFEGFKFFGMSKNIHPEPILLMDFPWKNVKYAQNMHKYAQHISPCWHRLALCSKTKAMNEVVDGRTCKNGGKCKAHKEYKEGSSPSLDHLCIQKRKDQRKESFCFVSSLACFLDNRETKRPRYPNISNIHDTTLKLFQTTSLEQLCTFFFKFGRYT